MARWKLRLERDFGPLAKVGIAGGSGSGCFSVKKRRTSLGGKIDRNGKEWQKVGRSGAGWCENP